MEQRRTYQDKIVLGGKTSYRFETKVGEYVVVTEGNREPKDQEIHGTSVYVGEILSPYFLVQPTSTSHTLESAISDHFSTLKDIGDRPEEYERRRGKVVSLLCSNNVSKGRI